jgi:hypothetical protein
VLAAGFVVFCLVDLARAKEVRHLPKWAWVILCLGIGLTIPWGGIAYLATPPGLAEVPGFLEDRRDLGIGHEVRPPLFVPLEQHPHPVLLGRVAEHGRALGPVQGALVGASGAEYLQESVDVLDGRGGQDHDELLRSDRCGSR